jgi:hypothetical protein
VRRDLYDKLIEASKPATKSDSENQTEKTADNPTETSTPNSDPARAPNVAQGYPRDWDDISVGHLVIAQASVEEGWWEAIVIAREGDTLTMRWRDYPGYPKLVQLSGAILD